MVGSSKILTVSYGTFSCTLEGFDDSFDTMKAIAEYFRDLAADDRYFGAEPPTPDADMMARIAEREIARRVEASTNGDSILLRAAPAEEAPEAEVAAKVTPAPEPVAAPEVVAPVAQPEVAPAAEAAPAAESIADKLRRIRSVAGPVTVDSFDDNAYSDDLAAAFAVPPETAEEEEAEAPLAESSEDVDVAPGEATDELTEADAPAPEAKDEPAAEAEEEAEPASLDLTEFVADAAADTDDDTGAPAEDDDSAPLQLADPTTEPATEETAASDETAPAELSADDAGFEEEEPADLELPEEVAAEDIAADDDATTEDDPVAEEPQDEVEAAEAMGEDVAADAPAAEDDAAEAAPEDAAEADPEEAPADEEDPIEAARRRMPDSIRARVVRMKREMFRQAVDDGVIETAASDQKDAVTEAAVQDLVALADDLGGEPEEEADLPDLAALDGIDEVDLPAEEVETAPLDDAHEDELQAELAAARAADTDADEASADVAATVEDAEILADDDAPEADAAEADAPEADAAEDNAPRGRDAFPSVGADDDVADVTRLLSETDAKLNAPETNRRREAMEHLKAAVAATEAARELGEDDAAAAGEPADAFRQDLDRVVRPRRAQRTEVRSERPRMPLLKLVASQRVDLPEDVIGDAIAATGAADPVRPRRVATEGVGDTSGTFSEYAESVGATELPDLLEAAAAYTSFIEGAEEFSRPQIMNKVRQVVTADFSREDSLRSFGTLLRQGRITKIRNGRFQITEDTRFHPEAHRAAQG